MSLFDRIHDDAETERTEGELYAVYRKEWFVLEDHEENGVIGCEHPIDLEQIE